jgi:hypothetical protein
MNRLLLLAALPLALAVPVAAQDENDPYAACAALTDSGARLACFDTTYAGQRAGSAERTEARRLENFGFGNNAPPQREAAAEEAAAEPEFTLSAAITEAFVDGLGKRVLLLDNGQLWRETTGSTMRGSAPGAGMQASISQSWSGAYQMRVDGRRGYIRVARVR